MRPAAYSAQKAFALLAQPAAPVGALVVGYIAIDALFTTVIGIAYPYDAPLPDGPGDASPVRSFLLLMCYASLALGAFAVTKLLHKRSPLTLFGDWSRNLDDFVSVIKPLLVFMIAINLLPFWDWSGLELNIQPMQWLLLLPFAMTAVLVQTGAEEIVYRGYLQQGFSARYKNPIVWMGVPSIIFGFAHFDPTLPTHEAIDYMVWTAAFGLAASDLTARTGSLGAAVALHFCTNLFVMAVYSQPDHFAGFALFLIPDFESDLGWNPVSSVMNLFYLWMNWMVCRIAIRR